MYYHTFIIKKNTHTHTGTLKLTVGSKIKPDERSGCGDSGMGGNVSARDGLGKKTLRLKREQSYN